MKVEFVTSSPDLKGRPEIILPEFAFIGRSNCGKSSLINHFLARNQIARISRRPGKTQLLNYFLVEDTFYLVDLPGYGYAKVSKKQRESWWDLFRRYFSSQDRPLAVFQLMDARHKPSAEDREMTGWIQEAGHPFALAATKIDKVGTNARAGRYIEIIETLGVPAETPFFPTSSAKNIGRVEMLEWVQALLQANSE